MEGAGESESGGAEKDKRVCEREMEPQTERQKEE